MYIKM